MSRSRWIAVVSAVMVAFGVIVLQSVAGSDSSGTRDVGWWLHAGSNVPATRLSFDEENPYIQAALQKYGENKDKRYPGTPLEAALAFLEEYVSYFTGRPHDESQAFSFKSFGQYEGKQPRETVVNFDLYFSDILVQGAKAWVWVDTLGRVTQFRSFITPPAMPEDVTPAISGAEAVEIVRAALLPDLLGTVDLIRPVIYFSSSSGIAYRLSVWVRYCTDKESEIGTPAVFYVDAHTGEILTWGLTVQGEGEIVHPLKRTAPDTVNRSSGT